MNFEITLLNELIHTLDPTLEKVVKPPFKKKGEASTYLNEAYHQIDLLDKIDPSHYELLFDSYPKKDILFLQQQLHNPQTSLYLFIKQETFQHLLAHYPVMPYKYMTAFKGSKLLFLNAKKITALIYLLSIYDVKSAFRTLIDQKLIAEIEFHLTDMQKLFFKAIQKDKEKVAFKKIPFETWDKKKSSLAALLYLRGLNRLSKTFAEADFYVKQELLLRLPLNDKASFSTLATPVEESVKEALQDEFETALNFLDANPHPY